MTIVRRKRRLTRDCRRPTNSVALLPRLVAAEPQVGRRFHMVSTREDQLLHSWRDALGRINEDLVGQEQVVECAEILFSALQERRSTAVTAFVAQLFGHWLAVGVRRLAKRGKSQHNLSIERLLESFRQNPDVLIKHAKEPALRAWLSLAPDVAPTPQAVRAATKRDDALILEKTKNIVSFANTIAHLQMAEVRLKASVTREALQELRGLCDAYHLVITGEDADDHKKDAFIIRFEAEVDRLLLSPTAKRSRPPSKSSLKRTARLPPSGRSPNRR